ADLSPSKRSAVELAIWFHDVIYDPTATDNEQRSAARAGTFLRDAGRPDVAPGVVEAIEMTAGHAPITRSPIIDAVHDADLGILGAPADRY
ncbi:metal-dependent phosphohydrolase, partial [bacterium LRH843]|nr:metal-dependent phosphohydrolase [bacterium LRH843]